MSSTKENHSMLAAIVSAAAAGAALTYATTQLWSSTTYEDSKKKINECTYDIEDSKSTHNTLRYPPLQPKSPVPSDIQISQDIVKEVGLLSTDELAAEAGILPQELYLWGISKAKVSLKVKERLKDAPMGNYVVVTGINPTPLGEGKSSKLKCYFL